MPADEISRIIPIVYINDRSVFGFIRSQTFSFFFFETEESGSVKVRETTCTEIITTTG